MADKERLDVLIAERGYTRSREKAKRQIMAGNVYVDGTLHDKPGKKIPRDSDITIKDPTPTYVSRGGKKLKAALDQFSVDPQGDKVIDIGSSTGGFTDCLLKNGASTVWAVDVGKGQLDWQLRNDPRVHVVEDTNARYLELSDIGQKVDLVTIDVSFISLKLILPRANSLLKDSGKIISLVKPQFEAGRNKVKRGGVVEDTSVHTEVLEDIVKFCSSIGLRANELTYPPLRGKNSKNIEFLLCISSQGNCLPPGRISDLVTEAHEFFRKDT